MSKLLWRLARSLPGPTRAWQACNFVWPSTASNYKPTSADQPASWPAGQTCGRRCRLNLFQRHRAPARFALDWIRLERKELATCWQFFQQVGRLKSTGSEDRGVFLRISSGRHANRMTFAACSWRQNTRYSISSSAASSQIRGQTSNLLAWYRFT